MFLLLAPVSHACSCKATTPREALKSYALVFAGEVSNVHYIDDPTKESPRVDVTFRVLEAWKGVSGWTVEMQTVRRDQSCQGIPIWELGIGGRVLVYANWGLTRDPPRTKVLTTDICSRTKPLRDA